jgi:outer membrane protein assembly factor BamB
MIAAAPPAGTDLKQELWDAAKKGDARTVESLLSRGVDANARTPYGATALLYASENGHLEVARILIKHKANVNLKDTFYGARALDFALLNKHYDVATVLIENGAKDNSSLLVAAAAGQTELVKLILAKLKPSAKELSKALAAVPSDHPEITELLKKTGAKPESTSTPALTLSSADLQRHRGTFGNDKGIEYVVSVTKDKLTLSWLGQALYTLSSATKNSFKDSNDEVTITFADTGGKISSMTLKTGGSESLLNRLPSPRKAEPIVEEPPGKITPENWPSFRGVNASGVADGQYPPTHWDAEKGENVAWKTPIPGIGHSCPIIWGDRLFVTTAVSGDPKASIRPGLYGDVTSVNDKTAHSWHVLCLDRHDGKILWDRVSCSGVPAVKRHLKGSHANSTAATDGQHIIACFGSEGLYCYDLDGKLQWRRDLGVLDSGFFFDADYQWGFGSSPIVYRDTVILQCDTGKHSSISAYRLTDGSPVWSTPRDEIPSWGTPTIALANGKAELVTNATKFARGYDPTTGKELWKLGKNAEITVPTPIFGQGLIFVTSGYRPIQPIYAVRPGASGDISPKDGKAGPALAWNKKKGGPYLPTPIVYGEYFYACSNGGIVTCYEAKAGKEIYKERLPGRGGYTASPVAADGKLYFTSEESGVRVVKAGPKFQLLASNALGDVCMTNPAICDGMIFIRTQHYLYGIGRKSVARASGVK